jgi:hypothetical protein
LNGLWVYMKSASKISTALRVVDYAGTPLREPRRRKRDARLWDTILTVYTTNPSLRERWPDMRAVRIEEACAIQEAAMVRLAARDPELHHTVVWVQAKDTAESTAQMAVSFAAWQKSALKRTQPLARVREQFRPPGPEVSLRAVYSKFLRATDFLTAEVAERQTR